MNELIDKLKELLGLVQEKLNDISDRGAVLSQGEKDLSEKRRLLDKDLSEFASREAAVIAVEYSIKVLRENEATLKENRQINADLEEQKQTFETWKSGEEKRIAAQLIEIAKEWKALRG